MPNDLLSIVSEKLNEFPNSDINTSNMAFRQKLMNFMESNKWFYFTPTVDISDSKNPKIIFEDHEVETIEKAIYQWLFVYGSNQSEQYPRLHELLSSKLPKTAVLLQSYFSVIGADLIHQIEIAEYLLYYLKCELADFDNKAMEEFINELSINKTIIAGIIITDFFAWSLENSSVNYTDKYQIKQRSSGRNNTSAYDGETYLKLIYYLFNPDYIDENGTMERIASSMKSADAFLYLSLHFICGVRDSDLVRLPHPILKSSPEEILNKIAEGKFTDIEARKIVNSVEYQLMWQPYTPSKTSKHSDVPDIKFFVPESSRAIIGTYLAAVEAHQQLLFLTNDQPLVRVVRDAFELGDAMGDDFFQVFLEENFSSRRANKAYLQAIELFADDVNSGISAPKGYMLAALARSHKGSYGEFAGTTEVYLKDANLSGLTPEFVAHELFERGVCSFIPHMLLKMLEPEVYRKLSVKKQTLMIKELSITPNEIEKVITVVENRKSESIKIMNQIIELHGENSKESILEILHNIGSGAAASKTDNSMCLLTAMNVICNDPDRKHCIGCKYEIKTKSIVYMLADEFSRLKSNMVSCQTERSVKKYKSIAQEIVLPALHEIIETARDIYGEHITEEFEEIVRRYA